MNKDRIAILAVVGIIISIVLYRYKKNEELNEYILYSKAEIVDYYNVGGKKYLKYEFYINNVKYQGEQRVNAFVCENGIEGCVGEKFTVEYSSKNPNNNEIDLGKYNKFKPVQLKL